MTSTARSRKCVLISYAHALNDPTSRLAAKTLADRGFEVTVLQLRRPGEMSDWRSNGVSARNLDASKLSGRIRAFGNWLNWVRFQRLVRETLLLERPDCIVTIMLHALAALPSQREWTQAKLISCIYDIPPLEDAGRLDRKILPKGWRRLREADLVWGSDSYKARLAQELGGLKSPPIVCHNCPPLNYLQEPTWPRNAWLRGTLKAEGASIGNEGGCILLRAGAVGEYGGIEETLTAMRELPRDFIFLLMGRPPSEYRTVLLRQIEQYGLQRRAYFWDRPDDETWKKALQGADIGHLIHGPFPPGRAKRLFELNSSLSNYRLFNYMAAGLPILAYEDPRMTAIYSEADCFRVATFRDLTGDIKRFCAELAGAPSLRQKLGHNGRQAHLRIYNWEEQFAPILSRVATADEN
jgi:glycosyltransferase involved in cell wall biosynthesis